MSEKTAMTLMVEHMAGLLKIEDGLLEKYKYLPDAVADIKKNWEQLNDIKEIATKLIEKEKQQIIDAYISSLPAENRATNADYVDGWAEQYYTQTYKP